MEIIVNKEVTYQVSKVKINTVVVGRRKNGLMISVPYAWLDTKGQSVLQNTSVNSMTQISSAMGAQAAPLAALANAIVPEVVGASTVLSFVGNDIKCVSGQYNANKVWTTTDITARVKELLATNKISVAQLQEVIAAVTQIKLS